MRLARSTGAGAGLLIVVLGLWGALIPFLGPYFHYGFSPDATWHFTTNRLWLDILPGAAAVLGGIGLIAASRRMSGVAGGWLALAGGVWFLVGPSLSMLWGHAGPGVLQSGIGAPLGGHDRAAIEAIGFFYGLGAVITMFAAFAIGRFASRPGIVRDEPVGAGGEPLAEPRVTRESRFRRGATDPEREAQPVVSRAVSNEPLSRHGGESARAARS